MCKLNAGLLPSGRDYTGKRVGRSSDSIVHAEIPRAWHMSRREKARQPGFSSTKAKAETAWRPARTDGGIAGCASSRFTCVVNASATPGILQSSESKRDDVVQAQAARGPTVGLARRSAISTSGNGDVFRHTLFNQVGQAGMTAADPRVRAQPLLQRREQDEVR
jgi:hypothetical protein